VNNDVQSSKLITAANLNYKPLVPKGPVPNIALIGCGGITQHHLTAYKNAGYPVVALCDIDPARVEARRAEFFPEASAYSDVDAVLKRDDVQVVDIATHPAERAGLIEKALLAGKHVLSQKPFVLDLDTGERLVELADKKGLTLAVNQNARWAPHFSYMRRAIQSGLIGDVLSADLMVAWNHAWVVGTPFEHIRDLILYDFAIHWFDITTCFFGGATPTKVYASAQKAKGQPLETPLLARVIADYDGAQASLLFNAFADYGNLDHTLIVGSEGTLRGTGPELNQQTVTLDLPNLTITPTLEGSWFPDGFQGAMAELLCAIEDGREPEHSARANLASLAFTFAAIASRHSGEAKVPGQVRTLEI
jgi:predicted dehydrogenase